MIKRHEYEYCLRCFGTEFFSADGIVCWRCPDIGVERHTYQTVERLSLERACCDGASEREWLTPAK